MRMEAFKIDQVEKVWDHQRKKKGCILKYYTKGAPIYYGWTVVPRDCGNYMKCLFRVCQFIKIKGRNKTYGGLKQCTLPVNYIVLRS